MEASSPRRRRGSNAAKVDTNGVDGGGITVRAHARSDANVRDWGVEGRCRGFKPLGRAVSDWAGDMGEGAAFVGHGSGAVVEGRSP
jgi:hypothetical protein